MVQAMKRRVSKKRRSRAVRYYTRLIKEHKLLERTGIKKEFVCACGLSRGTYYAPRPKPNLHLLRK